MAFLDIAGLNYLYSKLKSKFALATHSHSSATTSAAGYMSASDKSKLDGITAGANKYTHPSYTAKSSGLYKVTVDSTGHVSAATAVAKSDITGLGIPSSDTTYSEATTSAAGLMSASDKSKLDGITAGANKYTHPSYTAKSSGLYKVTVDSTGHVSAATAVAKSDITALGIPSSDTTYSAATTSAAGLMSASDKAALEELKTHVVYSSGAFDGLGWVSQGDGTYTQTITVSGVTASNHIMVRPTAAYEDAYTLMDCEAISQAANSITFECTNPQDSAVEFDVIIFNP